MPNRESPNDVMSDNFVGRYQSNNDNKIVSLAFAFGKRQLFTVRLQKINYKRQNENKR